MSKMNDLPLSPSILIDPGHGGYGQRVTKPSYDRKGGGTNPLFIEADYVLSVALRLADKFEHLGWRHSLTRYSDVYLEHDQRTGISWMMAPDVVLSLHVDSAPKQRGARAFFRSDDSVGAAFAYMLAKHYTIPTGARAYCADDLSNNGVPLWPDGLRKILHGHAPLPCVVFELGFGSWPADREWLARNINTVVDCIANGLVACFRG